VGEHKQSWEEGKCLIFDDTFCHSAVNNSQMARVILLLDFVGGPQVDGPQVDARKEEDKDQKGYLDMITAKYGYGVKEEEEEKEKTVEEPVDNCKEEENVSIEDDKSK
jgi:hypothetical protein